MEPARLLLLLCLLGSSGTYAYNARPRTWAVLKERLPSAQVAEPLTIDSVLSSLQPPAVSDKPTLFRERNGWCPYSERVWLAFETKNIDYDTVLIDNMGSGRPSWYTGQTPQVKWADGTPQSESMDIVKSLDERYPTDGLSLYPDESEVNYLIAQFKSIFPRNTRPSSRAAFLFYSSGSPVFRSEFEDTLTKTDELLGKHDGPFFFGDEFTAADIAWTPFLERYAGQLPVLHNGLNSRDRSKWPRLAAWYTAMETLIPCYAARVSGDPQSWSKVLEMQGYGNMRQTPDLIQESIQTPLSPISRARESMHSNMLYIAHQYYTTDRPYIAVTPDEQAAARIVRNKSYIVTDMVTRLTSSSPTPITEEMADLALRALVDALLSGIDQREKTLTSGFPDDVDEGGNKVAEMQESETDALVKLAANYFVNRMCIPRDMGLMPAKCIRKIAELYGS